jgi:hypothetical protein
MGMMIITSLKKSTLAGQQEPEVSSPCLKELVWFG